jgi:hypothetical protein
MPSRFPPRLPGQRGGIAQAQAFPGSVGGQVRNASPLSGAPPRQTTLARTVTVSGGTGTGPFCRLVLVAAGSEAGIDLGVVPIEGSELVYRNGSPLIRDTDYLPVSAVLTFDGFSPSVDDVFVVTYRTDGTACGVGEFTYPG